MSTNPPLPTTFIAPYPHIDKSVPSEKCTSKGIILKHKFLKMLPSPTPVYWTRQDITHQREDSSYLPEFQRENKTLFGSQRKYKDDLLGFQREKLLAFQRE